MAGKFSKFGNLISICAMIAAVIAAVIAWNAAARSQRAWIAPMGAEIVGLASSDKPLAIKLKFTNIGEEPAHRVNFQALRYGLFDLARGHGIPYVERAPAVKNGTCGQRFPPSVDTSYFPSSAVQAYERLIFIFTGGKIGNIDTNGVPQEFIDQKISFYIYGCITYETDNFLWWGRSKRESQYCLYFSPVPDAPYYDGTFEFCPGGNRAD